MRSLRMMPRRSVKREGPFSFFLLNVCAAVWCCCGSDSIDADQHLAEIYLTGQVADNMRDRSSAADVLTSNGVHFTNAIRRSKAIHRSDSLRRVRGGRSFRTT